MEVLGNSGEEGRVSQETERLRREPGGRLRYASWEAWQVLGRPVLVGEPGQCEPFGNRSPLESAAGKAGFGLLITDVGCQAAGWRRSDEEGDSL